MTLQDQTDQPTQTYITDDILKDINVFIDIETFGLDVLNDGILEIGLVITDLDLNILHRKSWLVWQKWYFLDIERLKEIAKTGSLEALTVLDMHTENNLFKDAELNGSSIELVEADIYHWLKINKVPDNQSLIGSSVNFDRMFLRFNAYKLFETFHYRVLDVSSLKVAAQKYAPALYESAGDLKKESHHRVDPDIDDSIQEFRFYLINLLHIDRLFL